MNTRKGYKNGPMSEEHKRKISEANKGRVPSPSAFKKGHKHSEETKEKIRTNRIPPMGPKCNLWRGGVAQLRRKTGRYVRYGRLNSRIIAENVLGRELKKREIIHHINENPADDRPENLFLFRHPRAHMKWHNYLWRNGLDGSILRSNLSIYSLRT